MLHMQRSMPWARLAPATRRVERRILTDAAALLQLTQGAGPSAATAAASLALVRITLAMRHGGFEFRATSLTDMGTALLAGAAKAEVAMTGGLLARRPRKGASRAPLLQAWSRVHAEVAGLCQYAAEDIDLPEGFTRQPACGSMRGQPRCGKRGGATLSVASRHLHAGRYKGRCLRAQRRTCPVLCVPGGRAGHRAPVPFQRGLPRRRAPPPWSRHAPHGGAAGMRLRTRGRCVAGPCACAQRDQGAADISS